MTRSSENILEVLKERRLRSAKASITFSETRDAIISEKAKLIKVVLADLSGTEIHDAEEMRMAALFYRMMDEYYVSPAIKMPTTATPKGLSLWRRVVKSCGEAGVEPEAYLRAQFVFFNKAFGRPPKLHQLATTKAQERAIAYAAENNVVRRVVGNDIRHVSDPASVMRAAEQQMLTICRAQNMTREDVYKKLVVTGIIAFPKMYTDSDPVYRRVYEAVVADTR